ncbi:MAG: acetyl-CoA carboxylase biotin carboxyl carrier protein subunit [Bacteroidales bacterium]|nr:acetyl-CoA carboxylase biotin carboxyl carrier protein subunit [Bacteroidales bacterium]
MEEKNTTVPLAENEKSSDQFRMLVLEGTCYKTLYNKKFELLSPWQKPDPKKMISFLPGTVIKVLVKKGDKVSAGQDLLLLEAMKMQNRIKSDREGIIKNVLVKEGDKVPKGVVMIEFR